jgi:glycosyltransferase involved in cell wall biosynthesis
MLAGQQILCLSNPTWEGNYAKTIVEMMKVLGQRNKVLYVDYQFTLKDVFSTLLGKSNAPIKRMYGKEPNIRKVQVTAEGVIYVYTPPPILPINFLPKGFLYDILLRFNTKIVVSGIKKALEFLRMNDPLIYVDAFNPSMGLYSVDEFKTKASIYYCYDEIAAAVWAGKHGAYLEEQFIPKVDGVIVTSQGLLASKSKLHQETHLVRNGVNFNLFNEGYTPDIPSEKIIGYIGSIDTRLDYDLLDVVITSKPNWEFHFVGRVTYPEGEKRLTKYPNVKLLGARAAEQLPAFLKTCAAGLIPFARNEFTKGIYPLKINEYLAAGLPVVMTQFSDLSEFKNIVLSSNNHEEFLQFLTIEVETDEQDKRFKRTLVAQKNSWEYRAKTFSTIIQNLSQHE